MKNLKITPPEGYEIDKEKSTFEEIIFKPVKKELPKSWEELGEIEGWYENKEFGIVHAINALPYRWNKNIFATEAQAKASIALAQLSQLREVYRDGWEPNWCNGIYKYCIRKFESDLLCDNYTQTAKFLSFQSSEIRDEFFKNFKHLIEEASPLLFG